MLRVQESARSAAWALRQLLCLFCALAAGAAIAQQAGSPSSADQQSGSGHAGATTYRVINLGSGQLSALPRINARGQVIYSIWTDLGSRGYFYDGAAVQDIGTLGGADTLAIDVNDAGQVTGSSNLADGSEHAFLWSAGGGMLDLGVLPGAANSRAVAINNLGVVTGTSEGFPFFFPHAFRWSAAGGMENLGDFAPGFSSFGTALNDAGLVAGNADTPGNQRQAFAWTRSGGLANIDTLGSDYSDAVDVGARGEVAGSRVPAGAALYRAYFWTRAGGMLDLGTAGGVESFTMAMSPNAHIAALVNLADGSQRAASWTRAGGLRQIGTLGGSTSRGIELNNKGQIVGYAFDSAQESRAFVWSARTGMVDLNSRLRRAPPGLVLEDALAINDSGAIVATSNAGLVLLQPGHGHRTGHTVGPIQAPGVVKVGTPLRASVAWVDEEGTGTRAVNWSWGDGSGGTSKMREADGAGSASASHSYAAPGIYPLTATVVDRNGRATTVSLGVVVAPADGALAGKGAILSPPGAFVRSPLHAGKARFSLVAPAHRGRTAAVRGQLRFDLPGLNLRSDSLRLLGRQGERYLYEGSGSNGGAGSYRFRLETTAGARPGRPGRFGIRIWRTDPGTRAEVVVYDNRRAGQAASALVAGDIAGEAAD